MGALSLWHWAVIVILLLLLFGRGKVSALLGDLGRGLRAFRRELDSGPDPGRLGPADRDDQMH